MNWEQICWLLFSGIGLGAMALVGFNALARAERWGRWWLEPNFFTTPKGILKRAKWLVNHPDWLVALTFLLPFLFWIGCIPLAFALGSVAPVTGFALGFVVPRGIAKLVMGKPQQTLKLWMLIVIVKRVAASCSLPESLALLYGMVRDHDIEVRIAAVNGFMELDPLVALAPLEKMQNDETAWVRATAKEAYAALSLVATGKMAQKVAPLAHHIQEHKAWKKSVAQGWLRKRQFRQNLRLTAHNIDEIVYSQLAQRLAFPNVYCKNCFARAIQQEYDDWSWVQCKVCGEADALMLGVKTVTGQIGDAQQQELVDGALLLPLWNEDSKTAVSAEVDVLEIVGGRAMNYDWAVSAAVQALQRRHHDPVPTIRLKLTATPTLERNTLLLLQSIVVDENRIQA